MEGGSNFQYTPANSGLNVKPILTITFLSVRPVAIMFGNNLKPSLDLRRIMETPHAPCRLCLGTDVSRKETGDNH